MGKAHWLSSQKKSYVCC